VKIADVGKLCIVLVDNVSSYPLLVNLLRRTGADSKNCPEFYAGEKAITNHWRSWTR
jgi:hypothetical protein